VQGALSVDVIVEFLELWDIISEVELQPGVEDSHIWRFSLCGQYTAKSAYDRFFQGVIRFEPYERIWKTWAPGKCRFFLWLVAHNRCWTADRLARHGLDHPTRCLHCDEDSETINHLLVDCLHEIFGTACCKRLVCKVSCPSRERRLSSAGGPEQTRLWMVWQEKA